MTRTPALLLCAALVVPACGGSGDPGAAGGTTTSPPPAGSGNHNDVETTSPPTSAEGGTAGSPADGGGGAPAEGQGAAPGAGASAAPPTVPEPVKASVAHACVKPGGRQELRVEAPPGDHIRFLTMYSGGGGDGAGDGDGDDGSGEGRVGDDGEFETAWVVPAGTPPGPAVVGVFTSGPDGDNSGSDSASFDVAETVELCPERLPWPGS